MHTPGNKYVSLGGRIVLLNSVLNAMPIFYLSFLKIEDVKDGEPDTKRFSLWRS